MTTATGTLPRRALIVAPAGPASARWAVAFDELRIVGPAELDAAVIDSSGHPFTCFVLSDLARDGAARPAAVRQILSAGVDDLTVVIAAAECASPEAMEDLRGLRFASSMHLEGEEIARFERSPDPTERPVVVLGSDVAPTGHLVQDTRDQREAERLLALVEAGELRERVAELQRQLESARSTLARERAELEKVRKRARRSRAQLNRLRRNPVGRLAMLMHRGADAGIAARAGKRHYRLALLLTIVVVAVLAPVAGDVALGWWSGNTRSTYFLSAFGVLLLAGMAALVTVWARTEHRLADAAQLIKVVNAEQRAEAAAARTQLSDIIARASDTADHTVDMSASIAQIYAHVVDTAHAVAAENRAAPLNSDS